MGKKVKRVNFSETIAACDLKVGRCKLSLLRYVVIEGQYHFLTFGSEITVPFLTKSCI